MNGVLTFFAYHQLLIIFFMFGIALFAKNAVNAKYLQWSEVKNSRGLTGEEVARIIMQNNGIYDVEIKLIEGRLTDHFNPVMGVVNLSRGVYESDSISAMAIAAHEVGHILQYKEDSILLKLRTRIFPIANLSSNISGYLIVSGLLFGIFNLFYIGLGFMGIGLVFQLITLPVEFEASSNAITQMKINNLVTEREIEGVSEVLQAAKFTYVVGALLAILNILRLGTLAQKRR